MDNMIRQVALLTEIMGEMKKNRAEPKVYGKNEEEEGMIKTEEGSLADAELKSGALKKRIETVEIQPGGEETTAEEESVVTSPDDYEQRVSRMDTRRNSKEMR